MISRMNRMPLEISRLFSQLFRGGDGKCSVFSRLCKNCAEMARNLHRFCQNEADLLRMVLKAHLICTIFALRGSRGGRGGGKHATLAVKVEKPTFRSGMEAAHTKNPVT